MYYIQNFLTLPLLAMYYIQNFLTLPLATSYVLHTEFSDLAIDGIVVYTTESGPLSVIKGGRNGIALSDPVMVTLLKRRITFKLGADT